MREMQFDFDGLIQLLAGHLYDGRQVIPCFSDRHSANQYFAMATAAGSIVIDAGFPFEEQLLAEYVKLPGKRVRLLRVDREDDPTIFRRMRANEEQRVQRLAEAMARLIRPGGQPLQVEVRPFNPPELTAVLRTNDQVRAIDQANSLMNDPNVREDVRELARELLQMSRGAARKLVINADNSLIQRLARQDLTNPELGTLLMGIYHSALIHNADMLTQESARILHGHLEELVERALIGWEVSENLKLRERALALCGPETEASQATARHRTLVLITGAPGAGSTLTGALKTVVEDTWSCELIIVAPGDEAGTPVPIETVRGQCARAAAVLCDLSAPTLRSALYFGMAIEGARGRPVIVVSAAEHADRAPFAEELGESWRISHPRLSEPDLSSFLDEHLRRHPGIAAMPADPSGNGMSPRRC